MVESVFKEIKKDLFFMKISKQDLFGVIEKEKNKLLLKNELLTKENIYKNVFEYYMNDFYNKIINEDYTWLNNYIQKLPFKKGELDINVCSFLQFVQLLECFSIEPTLLFCNCILKNHKNLRNILGAITDSYDVVISKYQFSNVAQLFLDSYCFLQMDEVSFIEDMDVDAFNFDSNVSMDGVSIYLKEIKAYSILSVEEEKELTNRFFETRDLEIRNRLVECNLPLVVSIAKKYTSYGIPFLDLINEGNIGLMKAIDRFNPKLGNKLSTYASWWIHHDIRCAIPGLFGVITFTGYYYEKIINYRKKKEILFQKFGREVTVQEIAYYLDMPLNKVFEFEKFENNVISLSNTVGDLECDLEELLSDSTFYNPEEEILKLSDKLEYEEAFSLLYDVEKAIITLRFGFYDGKTRTCLETGNDLYKFGFTPNPFCRETVRKLEIKAIRRLKKIIEERRKFVLETDGAINNLFNGDMGKKEAGYIFNRSRKNVYRYFYEYSEIEIDRMISCLEEKDMSILYAYYGNDLKNPVINKEYSRYHKSQINGVYRKMKKILENSENQNKVYKK